MRLGAVPGATGRTEAPAPRTRVEQKATGTPRGGGRGRKARTQRRALETAVQDRRDIRNEREPLARRHLPAGERHIDPDLLPAKDFTRARRVEAVTVDVEAAYETKRGAAR